MSFYYLGIFGEFFQWISNTIGSVFQTIYKYTNGLSQMVMFISSGFSLVLQITAWLPALFASLIVLALAVLIIKFVVGR